jgi:hypothetical protein
LRRVQYHLAHDLDLRAQAARIGAALQQSLELAQVVTDAAEADGARACIQRR